MMMFDQFSDDFIASGKAIGPLHVVANV